MRQGKGTWKNGREARVAERRGGIGARGGGNDEGPRRLALSFGFDVRHKSFFVRAPRPLGTRVPRAPLPLRICVLTVFQT